MMSSKDIRREMLAKIYSRGNFNNGYYEKLGILEEFTSIRDSNLYVLEDFVKKIGTTDELIKNYELKGNDLNSEVAFKELRTSVDLVFKPKSFFSFFS